MSLAASPKRPIGNLVICGHGESVVRCYLSFLIDRDMNNEVVCTPTHSVSAFFWGGRPCCRYGTVKWSRAHARVTVKSCTVTVLYRYSHVPLQSCALLREIGLLVAGGGALRGRGIVLFVSWSGVLSAWRTAAAPAAAVVVMLPLITEYNIVVLPVMLPPPQAGCTSTATSPRRTSKSHRNVTCPVPSSVQNELVPALVRRQFRNCTTGGEPLAKRATSVAVDALHGEAMVARMSR